ncbi:hypothetical protein C8F04DRAFT_1082225 [Mycena alexandri]|uniref:Uncharacterized protein n=1 Tax=Mycena alexandri TaxID=1745969 RepID=A0AAD6T9A0_9AGAR|nr:hypothetical protein C8F04DRAFT_1082225 [Mycena alexandri]
MPPFQVVHRCHRPSAGSFSLSLTLPWLHTKPRLGSVLTVQVLSHVQVYINNINTSRDEERRTHEDPKDIFKSLFILNIYVHYQVLRTLSSHGVRHTDFISHLSQAAFKHPLAPAMTTLFKMLNTWKLCSRRNSVPFKMRSRNVTPFRRRPIRKKLKTYLRPVGTCLSFE